MTPPSKLKMESPPGKNGSVGWGKFVVILVRNKIMLLVIVCSHLTISDGRDFLVPSLVIVSLKSSSSSAFPFLYLWAHSPVWSMKGPDHVGIWLSWVAQILLVVFLLAASTERVSSTTVSFILRMNCPTNSGVQIQWHLFDFFLNKKMGLVFQISWIPRIPFSGLPYS